MRLLESAPDSLTHRKEVLVAAKNLLSTPFRWDTCILVYLMLFFTVPHGW